METILANLILKLVRHGFIRPAMDVSEILSELMEEDYTDNVNEGDDEGALDPSSIVNLVGLRGDVKPEQPFGGMSVNPFFFDSGDSF